MRLNAHIKEIAKGIVISLFILVLLESGARVAYTILDDMSTGNWYIYSADVGWDRRPNFRGVVYGAMREFDSRGFLKIDTSQLIDNNRARIIAIGDSCTFGNGVASTVNYVEQLDNLLPNVHVINLAVPGYTSYQGYKILLKRGIELNPSAIIVSFGFNDRRYVLREEDADSDHKFRQTIRLHWLQHLAENLYLCRSAKFLLKKAGILENVNGTMVSESTVRINTLPVRVSPQDYRRNLTRIAELAKDRGIRLIFLMLKDNPVQAKWLKDGVDLLFRSQYELAIEKLQNAVILNNAFSDLARRYLAIAYGRVGQARKAEEILLIRPFNSLHGGGLLYLDSEYNQIMQNVAERMNVHLVNATAMLDQDPSVYYDFRHFDERGHRKIARLLYEALKGTSLQPAKTQ